jgi:two-component system chemotaxis response regulator CheB
VIRPQLIVVGVSLGGVHALPVLLGGLPAHFPTPLAIVQHRTRDSAGALGRFLQQYSRLPVSEISDKTPIAPAQIYVAPADYHALVEHNLFVLSTEGPVLHARPSIDVLFESAADAYAEWTLGVILTGASADGAQGLLRIKQRGGLALVESPDTAECPIMPAAAVAAASVDWIMPLDQIAPQLVRLCDAL